MSKKTPLTHQFHHTANSSVFSFSLTSNSS